MLTTVISGVDRMSDDMCAQDRLAFLLAVCGEMMDDLRGDVQFRARVVCHDAEEED